MQDPIITLQERLGYRYQDQKLLQRALTHRSYSHEHPGLAHNERLEFLGDAVLQLFVSAELFNNSDEASEGDLSRRRASLVSTIALGRLGQKLSLGDYLLLGKGEAKSGGRQKVHMLANVVEALMGACYLDGGSDAAQAMVRRLLGDEISRVAAETAQVDYKTELQERMQQQGLNLPEYKVIDNKGPEHQRRFVVEVNVAANADQNETLYAQGEASSIKKAQREAARRVLEQLDQLNQNPKL